MKLIKLSAIDSTNDYLKKISNESHLEDNTVVWAESQLQGRGQRDAIWHSEEGKSLTFSVFKCFSETKVLEQFSINCAVSIAVKKTLNRLGVNDIKIKWPNDIMAGNHKLGGILIENRLREGSINNSIIGIGLNVNNTDFHNLPKAISLYQHHGMKFEISELISLLVEGITAEIERLKAGGYENLKQDYETLLFRKDVITVFNDRNQVRFNGIVRGVTNDGQLRVETEDESINTFGLKEIEMLY
ncbi:MAG: biotin--[acetyl-CoA-carboxylase] ligase [Flavobacteriaceae bacterium]|nr:biotin--[acetyl-CoA-carboxylase] ligase [Flavobacteriaceae bacterium]